MSDGRAAVHAQPAGRGGVAAAAASVARDSPAPVAASLKILHVMRAPVGGLFRHVLDIARGQAERGHRVGLVADTLTGGERASAAFAELAPQLAFGVRRVAIGRQLSYSDLHSLRVISPWIDQAAPDILHGHGAKGAALARLSRGAPRAVRVYTPHGGTLVYDAGMLAHGFYRSLEWLLKWRTDLFLFESNFAAAQFRAQMGRPPGLVRVVHNGVNESEFVPIAHAADATDIVALGELRPIKGFDLLIEALAILKGSGRRVTATIGGVGSFDTALKAQAQRLGVADQIRFVGHRTAREAFAMGRILAGLLTGRIVAVCGARSRRRRNADHRQPRRRDPGNLRRRRRPSGRTGKSRGAGCGDWRGDRRPGGNSPGRGFAMRACAPRVFGCGHGGRRFSRLSRSDRDAKTRPVRITIL